ncbi:MAG: methyltransferase domain-containing protein [Patescibacteria group bacterium]|nr:methyltransferase domain-containing protein [Patescibacteria group bacterium]
MKQTKSIRARASGAIKAVNPVSAVAKAYVSLINKREYARPPFNMPNERPVEYAYVFTQLARFYPGNVLDVGTGVTALPHLMANCGLKTTAIDNVSDYWGQGMWNRHYLVLDDDIRAPRLKQSFDMITCVSTLEHIEECDEAVKSMSKLLNPGGHIVLTFPYNEKTGVPNVYTLPTSNTRKVPTFKARAYCRLDLDRWCKKYGLKIVDQEYWRYFTGNYWTEGEQLKIPVKVGQNEAHQISCVLFEKI